MNSSSPESDGMLAIENERCSSSWPGIRMSTYCPGRKDSASSSSTCRRSARMSWVSASTSVTRVDSVRGGLPLWMMSSS